MIVWSTSWLALRAVAKLQLVLLLKEEAWRLGVVVLLLLLLRCRILLVILLVILLLLLLLLLLVNDGPVELGVESNLGPSKRACQLLS